MAYSAVGLGDGKALGKLDQVADGASYRSVRIGLGFGRNRAGRLRSGPKDKPNWRYRPSYRVHSAKFGFVATAYQTVMVGEGVTVTSAWTPRGADEDSVDLARQARTDPRCTVVLRNEVNRFMGQAVAWVLLAMAAAWLNPSILSDVDPMRPLEVLVTATGLSALSWAAFFLGRSSVRLSDGIAEVVNGPRVHGVDLVSVGGLESGFWGFPRLRVGGQRVRLIGTQESTSDVMAGGSEAVVVLRRLLEEAEGSGNTTPVRSRWRRPDAITVLFLLGWVAYAASFLMFR